PHATRPLVKVRGATRSEATYCPSKVPVRELPKLVIQACVPGLLLRENVASNVNPPSGTSVRLQLKETGVALKLKVPISSSPGGLWLPGQARQIAARARMTVDLIGQTYMRPSAWIARASKALLVRNS